MTRVAVVGAGGMLGTDLMLALAQHDATGFTRAELDITDAAAALDVLGGFDVIINASAYTRVDDAEADEENAHLVNAVGPHNLALAAATHGARLVQLSTDYVFDGTATEPYAEDAVRHPVSAYGRTKAAGELLALEHNPGRTAIVRTAWLYGKNGSSFPRTMLKLAADRDTLEVVNDQHGQPTWTGDLAAQLVTLVDAGTPAGIFHGTNSGRASWFDLAQAVFVCAGLDPDRVKPTDSSAFTRPAPRPGFSVLSHHAWLDAGIEPMRDWKQALKAAFESGALTAE
ncbi:dTDP-4-dehydrorhamnose reductase [Salinibacterium sp. NSLL150]|uniref:dTDP-4-dehydrorhamnose reductase n=1 Tax=unclassified Salinibacterium TaxID=2632331 RepID=UPI0018CF3B08|nr:MULTISPECIES: dTDP-4-dehydrorhamnose reductase [unclassified Salinibacterium]MBH0098503.1 dTDP-4-dehydrorhamnose reductase [Salinibacterium sp. NSLL35]MBH0101258.1 dTDP-4-dehydrorhamnose reductase [Salinibacterium sp. NSLL150]MBH0104017.1 dTDP-4-dehydrorhamnose reductase [Salinibacterium sp. NSLL16]MBH0106778.1 dTDP-4-dehydrorhamnose reductase [Salinibacterium sp. NSLL17]